MTVAAPPQAKEPTVGEPLTAWKVALIVFAIVGALAAIYSLLAPQPVIIVVPPAYEQLDVPEPSAPSSQPTLPMAEPATCSAITSTTRDSGSSNGRSGESLVDGALAETDSPSYAELDVLAAAYAEAARFDDAVSACKQALCSARAAGDDARAAAIEQRLLGYQKKQPHRLAR